MHHYARHLIAGGLILFSGFYVHDIVDLLEAAQAFGLQEVNRDEKEGWATLLMKKIW